MKRKLMLALFGAFFLVPLQADAQRANRNRNRDRDRAVAQPAPIVRSGRLAGCRAPSGGRAFDCRSRVVYSSGNGSRTHRGSQLWVRADWGRIQMTTFRYRGRRSVMNQEDLRDVLGRRAVNRVRDAGRRAGLRGSLRGYWQNTRGRGAILVVTMGRVDVAEFVDFNRDGFVDEVFLIREARGRRMARRW